MVPEYSARISLVSLEDLLVLLLRALWFQDIVPEYVVQFVFLALMLVTRQKQVYAKTQRLQRPFLHRKALAWVSGTLVQSDNFQPPTKMQVQQCLELLLVG